MKKFLSVLLLSTVFSATIVSNVSAQLFASALTPASTNAMPSAPSAEVKKSDYATKAGYKAAKATANAYKANVKATTNFTKTFKDAPQPKWLTETKTICAIFSQNAISTRVTYDKKGRWLYTMSSYQQDKLALPIKRLVTRNFSGYDITGVQDIKEGQKQFYVIHLENKTSIKRVGVYEGELNVIEEFDKAL